MQWTRSILTGATLGLAVSLAPGANLGLCVRLARERLRHALPLILCAALTDCCYALACSLGSLRALRVDESVISWLSPGMLALAALLIWPAKKIRLSAPSVIGITALNPATAALWIAMSSTVLSLEHTSAIDPLMLALGTLIATGGWFAAIAYLSSRLLLKTDGDRLSRAFSVLLAAAALLAVLPLTA